MYSTGLRPGHNVHLAYVQCCCSESDFYFEIVLKHYIDLNFQNACAHSSSVCHRKWKSHLSQSLRCLKANLSEGQCARCARLPAAPVPAGYIWVIFYVLGKNSFLKNRKSKTLSPFKAMPVKVNY